ncbi:DNA ligase [Desulfoluna butyratoxydans]|uniref:Nucleic acid-binding ob-fold n=1 Tax=Desulfoluna butyratoxydans TaxID=231438 RepID=A0A4U8YRT2_9BACT|nr:DNA ligase [Desulfoluna butyratoxydans]VFQ46039.1 nucleic acid-binding ob-fold [Desulfoluna butyratoxydans]
MPRLPRCLSLIILGLLFLAPCPSPASPPVLQKAAAYSGDEQVAGWFMSEKLDGIRGYWTGTALITRKGKTIHAPAWFTRDFPPFELDGELWSARGDFAFIQRTVMDHTPSEGWRRITYNIFEVPNAPGPFPHRLDRARRWFKSHPETPARIIPQIPCKGPEHLEHVMADIKGKGGEGLIVKNPHLAYHTGRSPHVLKVKHASDMEGTVMGINEGKGKYKGMMGSLKVRLDNGVEFNLGTGFSDEARQNPPPRGAVVTFRYHGFTHTGKPRFASFMRVRTD